MFYLKFSFFLPNLAQVHLSQVNFGVRSAGGDYPLRTFLYAKLQDVLGLPKTRMALRGERLVCALETVANGIFISRYNSHIKLSVSFRY